MKSKTTTSNPPPSGVPLAPDVETPPASGFPAAGGKLTARRAANTRRAGFSQETGMKIVALAVLLMTTAVVDAAPPPVGSEDWEQMEPYADWIGSQHSYYGGWCCDAEHDGRPVEAETRQDDDGTTHWWVHVQPKHWPALTDHWVEVPDYHRVKPNPDEKLIRPPFAMAWIHPTTGQLYCFWPGEFY